MNFRTLLILGAALAGTAGSALAGEDSTERWHGVGPAFYEVKGGLPRFAAGEERAPVAPGATQEGCRRGER